MPYCPYTNSDLDAIHCNSEHIIPLALGGANGIEIPISRVFNSSLGSEIDGAMAKDFLIAMRRNKFDVRGHSGKRPVFIAKDSINSQTRGPIQARLDQQDGLKIWDPIANKFLEEIPEEFAMKISLNTDLELRFVAKVALSAGYFVYGEHFRSNTKHDELRKIMNTPLSAFGDEIFSIETHGDSRFHISPDPHVEVFRGICRDTTYQSIVGLVPSRSSLAVFVGILGHYIGMLNFPAHTTNFPNSGDLEWGHVIRFDNEGGPARTSFAEYIEKHQLSSANTTPSAST